MTAVSKLNFEITFETVTCCECGFQFAVPADVHQQWRRTGESFHCPKGQHSLRYGVSENDRLRSELEAERRRKEAALSRENEERARREATERKLSAARGQNTKLRKRAAGGACPCCNRTFVQLARHMATKHPDFA